MPTKKFFRSPLRNNISGAMLFFWQVVNRVTISLKRHSNAGASLEILLDFVGLHVISDNFKISDLLSAQIIRNGQN